MPDSSLQVKITADVTSLQAQSAVAKAELSTLNANVKSLAGQFVTASDEMKASLAPQLDAAAQKASVLKSELAALNAELRNTASTQPAATGLFGQLTAGVTDAADKVDGLTSKLGAFTGVFGKVGELLAVGFGADIVAEQIQKVAELGESYSQLTQKTGATTEQLAGLRLAASETNTDFNTVTNGLRKLGQNMQEALQKPSSAAALAFDQLHVSLTDSTGAMLPVIDVFQEVSQALATYSDGTEKADVAGQLLGQRFGSNLIPVMNEVGQNFADLQQRAENLGIVMSGSDIDASENFLKAQQDLQTAIEGIRVEIVAGSLPAFTALEQAFTVAAEDGGALKDTGIVLGDALKGVAEVAVAVVTAFTEIIDAANFVGREFGDLIADALALSLALDGDFTRSAGIIKTATADMSKSYDDFIAKASAQEKLFADTHNALWSNLDTSMPEMPTAPSAQVSARNAHEGVGPDVADIGDNSDSSGISDSDGQAGVQSARFAQNQITEIAADAASARKQISESEYQAQVSNWNTEIAQGKISKETEIQNEIAAQNQIYEAALQEAQKEAALLPAGTAAKAKQLDDIEVLTADHNATMAKLNEDLVTAQIDDAKKVSDANQKAADATMAAWQKAFQPISQAFDSSINGILQGTQTLQQAETKAASSIALAFIDAEAKKVVNFVAGEAMILARGIATETGLTAATVAGNASRLASKTAADQTGAAEDVAMGTAQITSSAYRAAAGAYSAVAGIPIVGPELAPVAAATAFAATMAFDVLSAEGGMVVPSGVNPLTQLHENEMVLPSYISQPLTAMLAGGNTSTSNSNATNLHFNQTVNGNVGADTASLMKTAATSLIDQVVDLTRNGTLRLPGR